MSKPFDVVVIGAGPGGYIAAIRAAQLGLSVACVDAASTADGKPAPGGTCTNVGCIPSKALLQSSEHVHQVQHALADHGIQIGDVSVDLARLLARKDTVVQQNNEGILYLFKKNKVSFFHGTARFVAQVDGGWSLAVSGPDADELVARHVIVATGSTPRALPELPFDETHILSNEGALSIPEVPARLGVIGAGAIGLEMASVWARLGAGVTILEALPDFLAAVDQQAAREVRKALAAQGLDIQTGVQVGQVTAGNDSIDIDYTDSAGKEQALQVDKLIVSIGRVPNTAGLDGEVVGLKTDERGFIVVDDACRSNLPNVWAVGDVVRGAMLAHKAEAEGVAVAETIAGQHGHVDYDLIPSVIYTSPEVAWVGKTEQQLKAAGREVRAGSFPFMANGRARALGDTRGFVKILADAHTDEVLGVHIVGPNASELVAEAGALMAFRAASEDIARICHAHPTLAEAMKEAALAVDGRTLNF